MATVGQTVPVPVKSAVASKVNWIAGIGGLLTCVAAYAPQFVPLIPAPWGVIALGGVTALATIWARTFKTASVTPSSVS